MEFVISLFGNAFGAAIVAGLFGMWQWRQHRKAQKEDNAARNSAATQSARSHEIRQLQGTVNSLIIADQTILYDRIKQLAKAYLKRQWVSVEEYEDLKRMHEVYHDDLCGNGFLDAVMDEVRKLEVRVL